MSTLQFSSYVVSTDPKISVIPDFLTPEECCHFINLAEKIGFTRSLVGRGAYASDSGDQSKFFINAESKNRTSLSVTLDPAMVETVATVEARVAGLVQLPLETLEKLVIVKYEPGQFFKPHSDGAFRRSTVFLYLNGVPRGEGGETSFPQLGLRIRPFAGGAVVWRNNMTDPTNGELKEDPRVVHEGLATTGDTVKYGINCFFNENVMRWTSGG